MTLILGTSGLVGINIVSSQVQEKLNQNARELLTSDLSVSARRELNEKEKSALSLALKNFAHQSYEIIDVYSMVHHTVSGQSRLVEIRSTQAGFPFYGKLETKNGNFKREGLSISTDLAQLWDVKVGDELVLGKLKKNVTSIVTQDPSLGFRGFALAPRVYVPYEDLLASGLVTLGTSGNFAFHFKLSDVSDENVQAVRDSLFGALPDRSIRITLPEDTSEQSGRVISIITSFMSLAALIGLVLALVGVFYLYQSQLLARLRDLALLNLYGLTKTGIIAGIVLQFTVTFVLVIGAQLLVILPLYRWLVPSLSANLGLELPPDPELGRILRLLPMLYALSLSMLAPLLLGLTRTSMGVQLKAQKLSLGRFRFTDFIPFLVILWFFAVELSRNTRTGTIFFVCLLLVFGLSTLTIRVLQKLLRVLVLQRGLSFPSLEGGIALRALIRSGHKLTLSFLSLAMACTLISLVLQLDHKIQAELSLTGDKPGLFIFDIQEEQLEEFENFSRDFGVPVESVSPMIRARLENVNGKPFQRKQNAFAMRTAENDSDPRESNNAVNLTYRSKLTPSEIIVDGEDFPATPTEGQENPLVSVEKRWAQRMGIDVGDELGFDVQGVPFQGKVANIKEIKWTSFYPNFFLTVQPGFLDGAPKTFLAIFPSGKKEQKSAFQREAVKSFANVSFIDVEELVGKLAGLFERSRQAIEIISWLSLSVGLVILYGLSHDQVYRRHYDLALMKSLGFSTPALLRGLILEFGTLFFLSMALGFFLGWSMANLLAQEIFKLDWDVNVSRILWPALFLAILCLLTILVSSWRAVNSRPRELLSDS